MSPWPAPAPSARRWRCRRRQGGPARDALGARPAQAEAIARRRRERRLSSRRDAAAGDRGQLPTRPPSAPPTSSSSPLRRRRRAASRRRSPTNIPPGIPVVACAKGIEQGTGLLQTDIIAECLPGSCRPRFPGPALPRRSPRGLPTAVTIAASDIALAHALSRGARLRQFPPLCERRPRSAWSSAARSRTCSPSPAGIVAGRALGESARAALIARGLAEMMRLGAALGARAGDVHGPCRRRRPGADRDQRAFAQHRLRHGARPRRVASPSCCRRARRSRKAPIPRRSPRSSPRRHNVETPIIAAVAAIIAGRLTTSTRRSKLLGRPLKAETD